jgi:hypothetical protein
MAGLVVNGGFMRELFRIYSKKILNKETKNLNNEQYKLHDLDIHLTSDYEIDYEGFITEERRTQKVLNTLKEVLKSLNCKIVKNTKGKIDLKLKNAYTDNSIVLYNLKIEVGKEKSKYSNSSTIQTQFVITPKSKKAEFVCNQICLNNNSNNIINTKNKCYNYLEFYSNRWRDKVSKSLLKVEPKLPEDTINNIFKYLNFDVKKKIENENRLGCFYLDRQSLSRCKKTSDMRIDDIFEQLSRDVTYFIGDCKETGCIPCNMYTASLIKENRDDIGVRIKWDKEWSSHKTFKVLKYRKKKLEERGIKVLTECSNNNEHCLWYKINNYDFYKDLYNEN